METLTQGRTTTHSRTGLLGLPRWLRRSIGPFLILVVILSVALALSPYWDHRNRGEATPCPNFLTMSNSQQLAVIQRFLTPTNATDAQHIVVTAIGGCRSESDETVGDALGP